MAVPCFVSGNGKHMKASCTRDSSEFRKFDTICEERLNMVELST